MPAELVVEATVTAAPAAVWHAWTTNAGIQAFLAPTSNVALAIGGPYEIHFDLDQPVGLRGSEGCKVLSYLPERMLSFSWNAPPAFPALRAGPHTWVVVELTPAGTGTRVVLTHLGYGEGEDWDALRAYFTRAWGIVMERLAALP